MDRKCQVEIVGIILIVFFLFMGILLGNVLLQKVSDYSFATMPASAQAALTKGSNMLGFFDSLSIVVVVIYAVLVVSFSVGGFSGSTPMLFVGLILYIPVLLASGGISTWAQDTISSPLFSSFITSMPITYNLVVNLPLICLVVGAVSLMFIFVTKGKGEGYAYG